MLKLKRVRAIKYMCEKEELRASSAFVFPSHVIRAHLKQGIITFSNDFNLDIEFAAFQCSYAKFHFQYVFQATVF